MVYRYGFELEGFYRDPELQVITVPLVFYPTDGFPGLIEFRTVGHAPLEEAFGQLLVKMCTTGYENFVFDVCQHTFSQVEKRLIRKRPSFNKSEADIRNIYGKSPKALGNKTIASLQINVSNLLSKAYIGKKGLSHPDKFTLLDVPRIVQNLDDTFKYEIKQSGRQPGEYCIKEERLEYRSLPNTIMPTDFSSVQQFLSRIKDAVEG